VPTADRRKQEESTTRHVIHEPGAIHREARDRGRQHRPASHLISMAFGAPTGPSGHESRYSDSAREKRDLLQRLLQQQNKGSRTAGGSWAALTADQRAELRTGIIELAHRARSG